MVHKVQYISFNNYVNPNIIIGKKYERINIR